MPAPVTSRRNVPKVAKARALYVAVGQLRVIRDTLEVVAVQINEPGDSLVVEGFTDNIQICADSGAEQLCLVAGECEAADGLVPKQHKVRQHGHSDPAVVPLDDTVGVKLPAPPVERSCIDQPAGMTSPSRLSRRIF